MAIGKLLQTTSTTPTQTQGIQDTMYSPEQMSVEAPNISPAREELAKSVAQDISRGQKATEGAASRMGIASQPMASQFMEKGYRIGNKIIAKDELQRVADLQTKAIKNFVKGAGFTDTTSMSIAEQQLNDKFNNIRLRLIKQGLEFDKQLAARRASEEERRQAAGLFGRIAGTLVGGAIGAYAGGPAGAIVGSQAGGQAGQGVGMGI